MLNFLKNLFCKQKRVMVSQPPSVPFPFAKNWPITAEEDLILALPAELVGNDEKMGDVINCADDALMHMENNLIYLKLKKGMSVTLTKNAQSFIVPDNPEDKRHRRVGVVPHKKA